jgi:KUP system potassium uptake protein
MATLLDRSMGKGRRHWLLARVVVASALLIGDGMLTPAISVLSAVQGLEITSRELTHLIPVLTAAILVRGRSFLATAALDTLFIGIDGAFFVALLAKLLSGALVVSVISAFPLGLDHSAFCPPGG